jgi:hypothetical protein
VKTETESRETVTAVNFRVMATTHPLAFRSRTVLAEAVDIYVEE